MKYNLCSSCMYFQPRMLTEQSSIPKSCNHPKLEKWFSPDNGGFISGTDIIHCDYHTQYPAIYGDVMLVSEEASISYVLTKAREFKTIRVPKLYDNSKSIKIHQL